VGQSTEKSERLSTVDGELSVLNDFVSCLQDAWLGDFAFAGLQYSISLHTRGDMVMSMELAEVRHSFVVTKFLEDIVLARRPSPREHV
jgi:hypothetical protein